MWGEFPDDLIEDYLEAYGLLVEDLEVMYGAYREDNQNCKMILKYFDIIFGDSLMRHTYWGQLFKASLA